MWTRALAGTVMLLAVAAVSRGQEADDCTLTFVGKTRKAVKLRTETDGATYEGLNNGAPVTVTKFFEKVCSPSFNSQVPPQVDTAEDAKPIDHVETIRAQVTGYVLAAKFEKDADHDLHVEIGAKPQWNTDHLIVEIPPGPEYCAPRKALWQIVKNDPAPLKANQKVLQHPVKVTLEGFVFLDFAPLHSSCKNKNSNNWCDRNGGRGMTKNHVRRTRGCYEVHPVLAVHAG